VDEAVLVHHAYVVDVVPLATLNVVSADHMEATHAPPCSVRVSPWMYCVFYVTAFSWLSLCTTLQVQGTDAQTPTTVATWPSQTTPHGQLMVTKQVSHARTHVTMLSFMLITLPLADLCRQLGRT